MFLLGKIYHFDNRKKVDLPLQVITFGPLKWEALKLKDTGLICIWTLANIKSALDLIC
jgi:hypothetical protein